MFIKKYNTDKSLTCPIVYQLKSQVSNPQNITDTLVYLPEFLKCPFNHANIDFSFSFFYTQYAAGPLHHFTACFYHLMMSLCSFHINIGKDS